MLYKILGWVVLAAGMGLFLFCETVTIPIRIIAIVCCVAAFVLFQLGRRKPRSDGGDAAGRPDD